MTMFTMRAVLLGLLVSTAGLVVAQSTSSQPPRPTGAVTQDGTCGARTPNRWVCTPEFGGCCSSDGWCGDTYQHCGPGCQAQFGRCLPENVTADGRCGDNGKICTGSAFGDCCSAGGWCGNTTDYCGAGCQERFGTCSDVSTDGQCGANGKTCTGSAFGNCCSAGGWCGSSPEHCGAGCQPAFGAGCLSVSENVSTDGECGSRNNKTCKGSGFGECCSSSGYCGGTAAHCGAGCQSAFGTCSSGSSNISTDGRCGDNGKTCTGSDFGICCSATGYCGSTGEYCGAGCQPGFGTCSSGSANISTDGTCGSNGKTCVGSVFGNCCSIAGMCGSTAVHCGQGCQRDYSSSCLTRNIPSVDGTCGPSQGGWTCNGGPFDNQCCSSDGYCGTTSAHCGRGCQRGYGRCD